MMVPAEHFRLQVITDPVNQIDFEERLAANEVPYHTRLPHLAFVVKDVVNGLLRHLPRHPLFRVLSHQITVFAGQLAILRHDERNVFRHAGLPTFIGFFDSFHLTHHHYTTSFTAILAISMTTTCTIHSTAIPARIRTVN